MAQGTKNRKRIVFWLTLKLTHEVLDYSEALSQSGYDVRSYVSLGDMMVALETTRPGILVVSDLGNHDEIRALILGIVAISDLSGTKMVMVSFTRDHTLHSYCVGQNFRDVIQGDLATETFIERFRYATAIRSVSISHEPVRLTIDCPAKILLPCRITGINKTHIKIESRLSPQPGRSYMLVGKIAEAMGHRALKVTITHKLTRELNHRFSSGFLAHWQALEITPDMNLKLQRFWQAMESQATLPQRRIYVAMTQSPLRTKVLLQLNDPQFLVTTALQRHSLKSEPHYFSPQLVIMDLNLALDQDADPLWEILKQATLDCKILLMVPAAPPPEALQAMTNSPYFQTYQDRIIFGWETVSDPQLLCSWIKSQVAPKGAHALAAPTSSPLFNLSADDGLSFASLAIGAQINSIHPNQIEWTAEDSLGEFTMLRLKSADLSTILKRSPLIKVTSQKSLGEATGLPTGSPIVPSKQLWNYNGLFSDLSARESKLISRWMIETLGKPLIDKGWLDPSEATLPEPELLTTESLAVPLKPVQSESIHRESRQGIETPDLPHAPHAPSTVVPNPLGTLDSIHSASEDLAPSALDRTRVIGREALKGIKDSFEGNQAHGWVQVVAPMVLVGGLMVLILWGLFVYLGKNHERSGSIYTEQLKNFSP